MHLFINLLKHYLTSVLAAQLRTTWLSFNNEQ